jgi:hypothetical protein
MNNMERWRTQQKLSYEQLGRVLDEGTTTVFGWCKGRHIPRKIKWPKISRITKLSKAQIVGIA